MCARLVDHACTSLRTVVSRCHVSVRDRGRVQCSPGVVVCVWIGGGLQNADKHVNKILIGNKCDMESSRVRCAPLAFGVRRWCTFLCVAVLCVAVWCVAMCGVALVVVGIRRCMASACKLCVDLAHSRPDPLVPVASQAVTRAEGEALARRYKMPFFETSAKKDIGVTEVSVEPTFHSFVVSV